MSKEQGKKTRNAPITKKVQNKVSPTNNVVLELTDDKRIGKYVRIVIGIQSDGIFFDYVMHRPIGIHDCDDDDWVISSPDELKQLLMRKDDPNRNELLAKRTKFVNDELVKEGLLQKIEGEYFLPFKVQNKYLAKKDFVDLLKAEAKEEGIKEKEFNLQTYLKTYTGEKYAELVLNELSASQKRQELYEAAEAKWPQTYRTLKGIMNDVPQVGLSHLKGLEIGQAASVLMTKGTRGDSFNIDFDEESSVSTGAKNGTQWYFCDNSIPKGKKDAARDFAKEIRKIVGEGYKVTIEPLTPPDL